MADNLESSGPEGSDREVNGPEINGPEGSGATRREVVKPGQESNSWLARFLSYFVAFALGLFVVTFLFTTVGISGDSMQPSLHDGERVFVPKYERWLREAGVGVYHRGDVIFFTPPVETPGPRVRIPLLGIELPSFYIKRVVGLPGERLSIERGVIYINGRPLEENLLRQTGYLGAESLPEIVIPPHSYFVMGDNRRPYGSLDSRRFGPIPQTSIAGRVNFVLWPPLRKSNDGLWYLNIRSLASPESYR
jgi:signal peptidase I